MMHAKHMKKPSPLAAGATLAAAMDKAKDKGKPKGKAKPDVGALAPFLKRRGR